MNDAPTTPPTSTAATRRTEPEVLAGISSGEGQPAGYDFTAPPGVAPRSLVTFGAAALLGLVASFGVSRYLNR
ncbi:MAG TPA: hypothetical protein VFC56_07130 [Stellaceae bacterium]|nr:hypothetical protein [Stellaceae bacterium]